MKLLMPIGWLLTWAFYYLGVFFSFLMNLFKDSDRWVVIWYRIYNECMIISSNMQERFKGAHPYWPWN